MSHTIETGYNLVNDKKVIKL